MASITTIRKKLARTSVVIALAGLAMLTLAACGGEAATPTAPAASGNTGSNATTDVTATPAASTGSSSSGTSPSAKVDAKLAEWSITLDNTTPPAGQVEFDVTNDGKFTHDLTVLDASGNPVGQTPNFKSTDGTKTLDVDLKPGTYKLICSIPGHADRGMKTEITVK